MSQSTENEILSDEDQSLDPRVKDELERLNHANEAINHLELQLDDARNTMKEFWEEAEEELVQLEKSIGSAVNKARDYYDARMKLLEAKEALIKAKHRFERAQALHVASKELAVVSADLIDEAEKSNQNATTWNETYDQALAKAADAEREKYQADLQQQQAEENYSELNKLVQKLQKDYRRAINKSQPYYEKKAEFHKELDFHKRKVVGLENCVHEAKSQYQETLKNLEKISNEIHAQRKRRNQNDEHTDNDRIKYTEFERFPPSPTKSSPSESPSHSTIRRYNRTEQLLRSCLLQTEVLPAGIFAKPSYELKSSDNDQPTPTNVTDLFLMPTRETSAPPPIVIIDSIPSKQTHKKKPSDDFSSHMTDEEDDDKTGSLHILSDEQVEHLASTYQSSSLKTQSVSDSLFQSFSRLLQRS